MSSRPLSAVLLAVSIALVACGEGGAPVAPAPPTAEPADDEHRITPDSVPAADQPSIATRTGGGPWVVYVQWDGERDALAARPIARWDEGPTIVHEPGQRVLGTAATVDADDRLHLVWSQEDADGQGWTLWHLAIAPDPTDPAALGTPGEPARITTSDGDVHHLHPRFADDGAGRHLLVWQRIDVDGLTIRGATFEPATDAWSEPVAISRPRAAGAEPTHAWSPDAAATSPGRFAVVWDEATSGDFDVHLARVESAADGLTVASRRRVTSTPRLEAAPSVAVAPDGERLYVAYHVGPEDWGREGSRNALEVALHGARTLEIVGVEGDRVAPLVDDFVAGLNENLADNCEQPQLHVDGSGTLVLFFRGLPLPSDAQDPLDPAFQERAERLPGGKGWRTSIWFSYWSALTPTGWVGATRHHVGIEGSEGRCAAPIAVGALRGGGTAFAVVGDRREREAEERDGREVMVDSLSWWKPITLNPTDVTPGRIRASTVAPTIALDASRARPLAPLADPVPQAPPVTRTAPDGTTWTLALGDLHRHTDVSRCSSNWDGPVSDALRYALAVGGLEYMAVTDHFEHMLPYDWWRLMSWADAYDVDGLFANLRGYERADAATGHRNVIGRGDVVPVVAYRKTYEPLRDDARADDPAALFEQLDPDEVLTIPHTPAGMFANSSVVFDWADFDPSHDRLVEIFQGYRGASEGAGAPRSIPGLMVGRYVLPNLDRGMHFGFTAASDHQSSDGAFGGAWVTRVDRAAVFDALSARRTFASTVPCAVSTSWTGATDGEPVTMGESARRAPGPGVLDVHVDGLGLGITRLDVVADGERVDVVEYDEPVARASEAIPFDAPVDGERFVYVRVVFEGNELAWSSPIRLGADDWVGPDGRPGSEIYGGADADRR